MLAHWWVELASHVGGCRAGVPDLLSACWCVGTVPDMAGCRIWSVAKLVLACLCLGLGPGFLGAGVSLLLDGTVSLPGWLLGVKHPSTGAERVLGRVGSLLIS